MVKFDGSSFNETEFDACQLTAINWTQAHWPGIALASPLFFRACDISFSSFYELKLSELLILNCKAHDVDFRNCDLTRANFTGTDLEKTEFMHTMLNYANFRDAINYIINPLENSLAKAKFSFPEVVNLLHHFNIEIENFVE